jgi:enoyl-CoA hydratase
VNTSDPEILIDRRGTAGIITLNRPAALNAVTRGMVATLHEALERWRHDGAVSRVIVRAAGERAFSAGGDLRQIYDFGRTGRQSEVLAFWREEYTLNAAIKHYPKPYVALIDGIVMGGGVGISIHGSHRVAGDRFQFAMPEVSIGFFPDVGGTWFLPRLPGELGTWCALCGDRIKAADAVATGVATHRVASARFPDLVEALCGAVAVDAILAAFAERGSSPSPLVGEGRGGGSGGVASALPHLPTPTQEGRPLPSPQGGGEKNSSITARRGAIDRLFAADSVEAILAGLDAEAGSDGRDAEWSRATAAALRAKAPTSLKLALAQMRRGRDWSFAQCMRAEFRIASRAAYGEDFYEGIRAVIVDKDNSPRWRPATLAEVSDASIEHYFAPIAAELELP